jgi:hypothetical protein
LESAAAVAAGTAKIRVAGVSKKGRHSQVVKSLQLVSRRTSSSLQVFFPPAVFNETFFSGKEVFFGEKLP